MKNTLFIAFLALSTGSLFAQPSLPTVNYCPYFGQELLKFLVPNPDQCNRIDLINQQSWPELEKAYQRLQEADNQIDSLRWTEELPVEDAARKIALVLIERRKLLAEAREAEAKKNRLVLGVLNEKQRQMISQLMSLAPALRLFNDATSAGLIPYDLAYPVGSGMKGSAGDRMRQ